MDSKKPPKRRRRQRRVKDLKKQSKKPTERKKYNRGKLIHSIYAYFDKVGFENITYDDTEKLAKKIKPDTKFNKYHYAWYRNDYKNKRDIY